MKWTATCVEVSPSTRTMLVTLRCNDQVVSYGDVLAAWRNDPNFRSLFNALLAESPYKAFRWETPPITRKNVTREFEFVLLNNPSLDRPVDTEAFAEHFPKAVNDIAVFANIGRDATMIVPAPLGEFSAYGHLAAFVRHAPAAQRDALWRTVGETLAAQLGKEPLWLSTAGAGVSWLHVRLDTRPKYYGYEPYRAWP